MNGIKYLLDTTIIIGKYEHNPTVINLFNTNHISIDQCAYSSITRMELFVPSTLRFFSSNSPMDRYSFPSAAQPSADVQLT